MRGPARKRPVRVSRTMRSSRTALGKAGCGPTEALFVGDALEADVAGANPLGMTSVYLRADGLPEAPAEGPQPAHTVSALSEILGLVSVASS